MPLSRDGRERPGEADGCPAAPALAGPARVHGLIEAGPPGADKAARHPYPRGIGDAGDTRPQEAFFELSCCCQGRSKTRPATPVENQATRGLRVGARYAIFSDVLEAKLHLRVRRDPAAALAALERAEAHPKLSRFAWLRDFAWVWRGFALLLEGQDERAYEMLAPAVTAMRDGHRLLELPTGAVYLAEAAWRCGEEEAADRATEIAYSAAQAQGSNNMLIQALADFPAVLVRRLDIETEDESPWHQLGRALRHQAIKIDAAVDEPVVSLQDLGSPRLTFGDQDITPGMSKSLEAPRLPVATGASRGAQPRHQRAVRRTRGQLDPCLLAPSDPPPERGAACWHRSAQRGGIPAPEGRRRAQQRRAFRAPDRRVRPPGARRAIGAHHGGPPPDRARALFRQRGLGVDQGAQR